MVSQGIFIGVAIGVFFAGLGIGYVAMQSSTPTSMMVNSQQMQQMMNDPQMMNQWMNIMMNDTQTMQQMHDMMMSNPQHMNQMMGPMMDSMMNDQDIQQQMMNMMMNNQQMMNSLMNNQQMMNSMMNNQQMMNSMMNNQDMMDMVGSGMMNGNMMTGDNMMGQQIQKQNKDKQTETISSSYVQMIDGIQIVTIHAKEFKFIPSEININIGKTKFVMINDGIAEHELVVYDISKKDIVDKAELAEDEVTIEKNILFEIEEVHSGESGETDVLNLHEGSYVMGCHVPGHYEAGMTGIIEIKS